MKKRKKASSRITERDYIKAMRKASREMEIELHGKQVSMSMKGRVHESKKAYKRNKVKDIEI